MAADQQELKTLLGERMRQASVPTVFISVPRMQTAAHIYSEQATINRRNELTAAILQAIRTPNRPVQGTPSTFGETKIARNAVYKSVASVLTASEHLIREYDRLDQIIVAMCNAEPEGIAEAWTEEVDRTARLLKIGAETAIKNVKQVLGADVGVCNAENIDGESLTNGETMEALEKMELNYDLHKSLQLAERGVKKMVKSLPTHDES